MRQRTEPSTILPAVPPPRTVADLRARLASVLVRLDKLEAELAAEMEVSRDLDGPTAQARALEIDQLRLRIKGLTGAIRLRQMAERSVASSTIGRK